MGKYKSVYVKRAEEAGRRFGGDAADWYFDRCDLSTEDYQKVLKGIREGDPEIMDTMPSPLSGENADDAATPHSLYKEVGLPQTKHETHGDEVCTAYENEFSRAYWDNVENQCIVALETDVCVKVYAVITAETPNTISKWASQIEEAAATGNNVSINDTQTITGDDVVYA